jgi:hypothetical protein
MIVSKIIIPNRGLRRFAGHWILMRILTNNLESVRFLPNGKVTFLRSLGGRHGCDKLCSFVCVNGHDGSWNLLSGFEKTIQREEQHAKLSPIQSAPVRLLRTAVLAEGTTHIQPSKAPLRRWNMDGGDSTLPILAPIAITSPEHSHYNLTPSPCIPGHGNQAANVLSGRKNTLAIGQLLKKLHPEAGRRFGIRVRKPSRASQGPI